MMQKVPQPLQEQLVNHMEQSFNNFYFMINPFFPTKIMMEDLSANLLNLVRYYPSNQEVIANKIRRLENVDIPLLAVNGSCEAIRIYLQNFGGKVLATVPNFNEWEITDHISIAHDAPLQQVREVIHRNKVDTVCFCNPNNPTGFYRNDLEVLASEFKDVTFVIDISFLDFAGLNTPNLPRGKNIILVKSLGKNYGICGARLGYIASENGDIIRKMLPKIPIWNVNSIAEYLIDLCIKYRGEYEESRKKIVLGTQEMYLFLKEFDFLEVFPTKANFVFAKSALPLNFNVKCCDNKTGLDQTYYRFAYNPNYENLRDLFKNQTFQNQ